jgi:hypothetical protein
MAEVIGLLHQKFKTAMINMYKIISMQEEMEILRKKQKISTKVFLKH